MLPIAPLLAWFDTSARSLPWRGESATPWRVFVSEFMLQQTPVSRVIPRFDAWMLRWPTPSSLALASTADVLREWQNLGYPRRAVWLRDSAVAIHNRHSGAVPEALEDLLALPGVGDYTARAVLAFGFGRRVPVVDTNVRRVLARTSRGVGDSPIRLAIDMAEVEVALPAHAATAARASLALMEFGALVCTARSPKCGDCPVAQACAWRSAGYPDGAATRKPQKAYEGSDRQVRGRILTLLRNHRDPVPLNADTVGWHDEAQVERAKTSLAADRLILQAANDMWQLPGF